MSFVPPPPRGLGGSSNYIITAGGAPLVDLAVNVAVSEAIFSTIGFAFQLNCWSLAEPAPPDPPTPSPANTPSGWQQFYLFMATTDHSLNPIPAHITAGIEPWPASKAGIPASDKTGLVNWHDQLTPTLDGGIVPAGTLLSIVLQSNDDLQIQFVTMTVTMPEDAGGQSFNLGPVDMTTLPLIAGPGDETSANLAPIVAFQMNLVGPISARKSYLYSGAGTFTYISVSPLLVTRTAPADVASTTVTEENANSGYLLLPAGPSNAIEQYFFTAPQDIYAPGAYLAASRQFGTDQTDVFIVNQTGRIDVYCSSDLSPWQLCSPPLGPPGLAEQNAFLAASELFGFGGMTAVFVISQWGFVQVFVVAGTGEWLGPGLVGQEGGFPSGAPLAASKWFGTDNTILFSVSEQKQLSLFFTDPDTPWVGPVPIGSAPAYGYLSASQRFGIGGSGGEPIQTDVYFVDEQEQLTGFFSIDGGPWIPEPISGPGFAAPAGCAVTASQRFGIDDQTDVYLVDHTGTLNVFSFKVSVGTWSGPTAIGNGGLEPGAPVAVAPRGGDEIKTDVFVVDKHGQLNVFSVVLDGQWSAADKRPYMGLLNPKAWLAAIRPFPGTLRTDVFVTSSYEQLTDPGPVGLLVYSSDSGGPYLGPAVPLSLVNG